MKIHILFVLLSLVGAVVLTCTYFFSSTLPNFATAQPKRHQLETTTNVDIPFESVQLNDHQVTPINDFQPLIDLIQNTPSQPVPEELMIPPAVRSSVELTDADKASIFNLVIADILQNPGFESSREFYGTPGHPTAILIADGNVKLPTEFKARVPKWDFIYRKSTDEPDPKSPRMVAICFDKFEPHRTLEPIPIFDGHVAVSIFNGGGDPDDTVHIGACLAYYTIKRSNDKWRVDCVFAMDP